MDLERIEIRIMKAETEICEAEMLRERMVWCAILKNLEERRAERLADTLGRHATVTFYPGVEDADLGLLRSNRCVELFIEDLDLDEDMILLRGTDLAVWRFLYDIQAIDLLPRRPRRIPLVGCRRPADA